MTRTFDEIMGSVATEFRATFCVVGYPVEHNGRIVLCPEPLHKGGEHDGEYYDNMPVPSTVWPLNEGRGRPAGIRGESGAADEQERKRRVELYREAYSKQDFSEDCVSPLPGRDTRLPRSKGTGSVRINRVVRESQLVGALVSPVREVDTL